jgi:ribose-phosphate pyrophosphokinase
MNRKILSGSANLPLTEKIAKNLGVQHSQVLLERFPDSELHFEIQESVRGHDVYICDSALPTSSPVFANRMFAICTIRTRV